MSLSMYMQPVPPKPPPIVSMTELKWILGPRYWGHDGSLHGEPILLTMTHLDYLTGVAEASHDEVSSSAWRLIDAIRTNKEVWLWIGDPDCGPIPGSRVEDED